MDTSGFDNADCHNPNLVVPHRPSSTVQELAEELVGLINGSSPRDTVAKAVDSSPVVWDSGSVRLGSNMTTT